MEGLKYEQATSRHDMKEEQHTVKEVDHSMRCNTKAIGWPVANTQSDCSTQYSRCPMHPSTGSSPIQFPLRRRWGRRERPWRSQSIILMSNTLKKYMISNHRLELCGCGAVPQEQKPKTPRTRITRSAPTSISN